MNSQPPGVGRSRDVRWPLALPILTAFVANLAFMTFEIVAGRLIARTFGTSLYTWTSVIGVCLAGMAVGNYLGGRAADRYRPIRALSTIFLTASICCVAAVMLNQTSGEWIFLYKLSWPQRISTHATILFLPPTLFMGMVSPVATRIALDGGLGRGRTVGSVYAFSTIGAIGGTFLAGFWLIPAVGSVNVIWIIAILLATTALLLAPREVPAYAWCGALGLLAVIGMSPQAWAKSIGSELSLRGEPDDDILYEKESRYSYITVRRIPSEHEDHRELWLDQLSHSRIIMGQPTNLLKDYKNVYADVTARYLPDGPLTIMNIGGGGYTFPRYLELTYPGSSITVVEIDPAVPRAAMDAFGLPEDTPIQLVNMDGRNYVEQLLRDRRAGKKIPAFDFIYCDAANHFSVPFHLTTLEFVQKIKSLLKPGGIYLLTTLDIYRVGRYSGAIMNTFRECFEHMYAVSLNPDGVVENDRDHFIVIGSDRELNLEGLGRGGPGLSDLRYTVLEQRNYDAFAERSHHLVLRDDYAPVENLLSEVGRSESANAYYFLFEEGVRLAKAGKIDAAIKKYRQALQLKPDHVASLVNLGILLQQAGDATKSIQLFEQAEKIAPSNPLIHFNLAGALSGQGRLAEAVLACERAIELKPDYVEAHSFLGNLSYSQKNYAQAAEHYRQSLDIRPDDPVILNNLAATLVQLKDDKGAIAHYEKALRLKPDYVNCLINFGNFHKSQGRMEAARSNYEKALKIEPDNAKIKGLLRHLSSN